MLEKKYQEVKGIVHKCRKEYYLHLWEVEDWDQEGMLCLYELLEEHPELMERKGVILMHETNDEKIKRYIPTLKRNLEIGY